jgi:hypothetical protein
MPGPCELLKIPSSEDPRIYLLKLSEKGSEQGFEGGFGRCEEGEMGRKEPSRRTLGPRHRRFRGFSDSFSTHSGA